MKRTVGEARQFMPELVRAVSGFLLRLSRESERAAVILGVARVDHALEKALKALLHAPAGGEDKLFDSDRALGTLSAKIAMAHRLGLINDDTETVLQALRKIRNDFAHSIEDESLSLGPHRDRLKHIAVVMEKTQMWSQFSSDFLNDIPSVDLRTFSKALVVLIAALEMVAWGNEPLRPELTTAIVFQSDPQ